MNQADVERFLSKVSAEEDENGCLIWLAGRGSHGYGHFRLNGKSEEAHRIAWALHNGPIPNGLWCLHRCDVRECVNVQHLFLGTRQDNIDDMIAKGRGNWRLNDKQAREIKWLALEAHYSQREIGEIYGVDKVTVWNIKHGRCRPLVQPVAPSLPLPSPIRTYYPAIKRRSF
jgi:hypothetical protein